MSDLILETSSTAQWHRLITEAESHCGTHLDEDAESYLVFLLMRYLRRPDLLRRVMAMGYLQAMLADGHLREERLRDVGDECLILTGLFPGQARRRRVNLGYFIDIGRGAYGHLGESAGTAIAPLYLMLADAFRDLMDVLNAMRAEHTSLDVLIADAADRYWQSGSPAARRQLEEAGCMVPPE
ncbi:MAG: hypothetical protein WDZ65_03350, partial [Aquisalimonadaceae bacterium]